MVGSVIGVLGVLLLWIAAALVTGHRDPSQWIEGADGKLSTSKFQWFAWTAAVIYSYTAVFGERFIHAQVEAPSELSPHLLLAMGMSAATMASAKGITSAYVSSGRIDKRSTDGGIMSDDDGFPDLSKIQMIAWTVIGIVAYGIKLGAQLGKGAEATLPDIDQTLMVLMGLSQGAYLGKKLTTADTPRLTGVSNGKVTPGTKVSLFGLSLGSSQGGNLLTIDTFPISAASIQSWTDNQ